MPDLQFIGISIQRVIDDQINIIIRDQDDYDNKKDTTFVCYQDMERTWAEKSERL